MEDDVGCNAGHGTAKHHCYSLGRLLRRVHAEHEPAASNFGCATAPVTTAEPERFFGRVTLAATSIRVAMAEDKLEAICMLQVYRQCPGLTNDAVLEEFSKSRRK